MLRAVRGVLQDRESDGMTALSRDNAVTTFCIVVVAYHFAIIAQLPTWFGFFMPQQSHVAVSIAMALTLVFLLATRAAPLPGEVTVPRGRSPWLRAIDLALLAAALVSLGFVVFWREAMLDYGFFGVLDTRGMILAMLIVVPLLEAVRRKAGAALPIIILLVVAIALFQQYLPGILYGRGYPPDRLLYSTYIGSSGVFGKPIGIAANIVIVFLVFGALMERAGASRWFMDLALALAGWSRGGPAKASVLASAMFGSISGSPAGNSATTGVFTIPLMKRVGYKPKFAAGVEAVASTGGIILPPVMGAIAFLMAEWIGRRYVEVMAAAAIPAVLYFLVVFASVHFEARRNGIRALPWADLPRFWATLRRGWFHLIPIAVLVHFLIFRAATPGMAGIYACLAVIVTSQFASDRDWRLRPAGIAAACRDGVLRWLLIAVITATVGIMLGALELSGVGLNISRFIVDLSGGQLLPMLIMIGIVSIIVGMGLDATPAYVTLATLMAPALIAMGVPDIAAHLYVIYWGLASFFTPPTCIAVFVTAPIAGSRIWETGWEALRLGIAAFVIPIAFALNPALLLIGTLPEILMAASTALAGAVALAAGLRGFALWRTGMIERCLLCAGGFLLIMPGLALALGGLGLIAVSILAGAAWRRLSPKETA